MRLGRADVGEFVAGEAADPREAAADQRDLVRQNLKRPNRLGERERELIA